MLTNIGEFDLLPKKALKFKGIIFCLSFFQIHFQQEQDTLYEMMVEKSVGTKVADLYINWAFYFNMKHDYHAAERIFRRGLEAYAAPQALLRAEHQEFGYLMSQSILYKNNPTYKQQVNNRMQRKLQEIAALRLKVDGDLTASSMVKSMALH